MNEITEVNLKGAGLGCVLRVWGDDFVVDDLLSQLNISACKVFRKGQKKRGQDSQISEFTGFHVVTSEASENDLAAQIEDTIQYFTIHRTDIATIMSFGGVDGATLDFSLSCKLGKDRVAVQNSFLPVELIELASEFGIVINLSLYPGDHINW